MAQTKHILLGVSGGIAAYKAVALASQWTGQGHNVRVVMTASACQLIQPRSFAAVTGQRVYTCLWEDSTDSDIEHISLVDWARVVVVAPATANTIGQMAGGLCNDLLSTLLCAGWEKPTLLAPAMNTRMWHNPHVQANVQKLSERGVHLVGPESGPLACGDVGVGRMAEPEQILAATHALLEG